MKRRRFTEEQIAFALRQVEGGVPAREVCGKLQISEQTFYRWKKKLSSQPAAAGLPAKKRASRPRGPSPRRLGNHQC